MDEIHGQPVLLGLGFDHDADERRVTRGEEFLLVGGSELTHRKLLDRSLRFTDRLRKYGRRMNDISEDDFYAIVAEMKEDRRTWFFHKGS